MKVFELIEALQLMPQDLEVYAYCLQGRTPEQVCTPSIVYTETLSNQIEDGNWTDDDDEIEEYGYTEKFVLL